MSGEQLASKELKTSIPNSIGSRKSSRVNINDLLYKIRAEKSREKRENYVFLGLVVSVLAIAGIIASL